MSETSSARAAPVSRLRILMPAIGLAVAVLGGLAGQVLRDELIEPVARAAACTDAPLPWWCPLRDAVRIGAQNYVFAGVALLAAGAALVLPARRAVAALLIALLFGGAGLTLYSALPAAAAVVLALLGAAALDRG